MCVCGGGGGGGGYAWVGGCIVHTCMNHGEEVPTFWFRRVIIRVELLVHINGIVHLVEVKGHSVTFSIRSHSVF